MRTSFHHQPEAQPYSNNGQPQVQLGCPLCAIMRGLTAFLYQRDRDYCIGMISSRW